MRSYGLLQMQRCSMLPRWSVADLLAPGASILWDVYRDIIHRIAVPAPWRVCVCVCVLLPPSSLPDGPLP